ncbi:MAG: hypothetical protein GC160_07490 [Acidobacteria bacterium]|nr:hypothetical protein [Acidobacteriota bacterium]
MAWHEQEWVGYVSVSLKVALVLAVGYVAFDWFTRPSAAPVETQVEEKPLQEDLYVVPPKTNIASYATAKKLVGMDLWVRAGWALTAQPGDRLLPPLAKITPKKVFQRDGALWLGFFLDSQSAEVMVGNGGVVYVDDIFFSKDPKELYSHWSEQDWQKIEAGQAEPGMSETQVNFALGAGAASRVSPGGATRIVEYRAREAAGLEPLRVTFRDWIAQSVEPIPEAER